MISLAIGVPHTPWRPERARSIARVRNALLGVRDGGPHAVYQQFEDREPHWDWNVKLWRWLAAQDVTHVVAFADDTLFPLGRRTLPVLGAMIEAMRDRAIGLTSQHPRAPEVFRNGHRWYESTQAWLVGWGYVLPKWLLLEFLAWHARQPAAVLHGIESADDQLLNRFLAESGRTTVHPVPTIIDHDLELESTFGHPIEPHGRREPSTKAPSSLVRSISTEPIAEALSAPAFWRWTGPPPPRLECPPSEESWAWWMKETYG